jgi:hypothetical protein
MGIVLMMSWTLVKGCVLDCISLSLLLLVGEMVSVTLFFSRSTSIFAFNGKLFKKATSKPAMYCVWSKGVMKPTLLSCLK